MRGSTNGPGITALKAAQALAAAQDAADKATSAEREAAEAKESIETVGSNYMPLAGGTFTGEVKASASGQPVESYVTRNIKLSTTEETPTVNGEICFIYE